jgi:hypothetical protein
MQKSKRKMQKLNPNFKAQITNQCQNPKIKDLNFELWI